MVFTPWVAHVMTVWHMPVCCVGWLRLLNRCAVAFLDELMSSVDDNHDQVLTFDEMVKGTLCFKSNTLCVYLLSFLVPPHYA